MADFFYDEQVRRYLLQVMRVFSEFKIKTGPDENGTFVTSNVPIVYGDQSWMVSQIIKGQNENATLPSPMMSVWISAFELAPERRRDTYYEGKINAIEREWDNTTNQYTDEVGARHTIERYMPVPYNLTFQLDIWTTTTTTKLQLVEQILTIFNPMIQLQQNTNYFDWTSLFEMELIGINWTNRSIPQGSEAERDVCSLTFKVPIWINPPAKVKSLNVVSQIVTRLNEMNDETCDIDLEDIDETSEYFDINLVVTPGNFRVSIGIDGYANDELVLRTQYGIDDPELSWKQLFSIYGNIQEGISTVTLKLDEDLESTDGDIIGTVALDEERQNVLKYNIDVDTLPSATLDPVISIIDPAETWPGNGLPDAEEKQRYLLTSDTTAGEEGAIPDDSEWGISANKHDIIEYDGASWFVDFDSINAENDEIVRSIDTDDLYTWNSTNGEWEYTYLGEYFPGYWRVGNLNQDNDDEPGTTIPNIEKPKCKPKQ